MRPGALEHQQQDELVIRLRGVISEMESKMEEQVHTYEQKIKYLKQEIEMKKVQIENMRRLLEFKESAGQLQTSSFAQNDRLSTT